MFLSIFVTYRNMVWPYIVKLCVTTNWQEKAPYEGKAAKRKTEYEKLMNAYNKKQQVSTPFLCASSSL